MKLVAMVFMACLGLSLITVAKAYSETEVPHYKDYENPELFSDEIVYADRCTFNLFPTQPCYSMKKEKSDESDVYAIKVKGFKGNICEHERTRIERERVIFSDVTKKINFELNKYQLSSPIEYYRWKPAMLKLYSACLMYNPMGGVVTRFGENTVTEEVLKEISSHQNVHFLPEELQAQLTKVLEREENGRWAVAILPTFLDSPPDVVGCDTLDTSPYLILYEAGQLEEAFPLSYFNQFLLPPKAYMMRNLQVGCGGTSWDDRYEAFD